MSTVKYAHVRQFGPVAFDPDTVSNRGGYTIAFREAGPRAVEFALARCNPKDNFNKALGREIAEGRLKAGNVFVINTRAKRYSNIVKYAIAVANDYIANCQALAADGLQRFSR